MKIKKFALILVSFVVVLSTLACQLPFISKVIEGIGDTTVTTETEAVAADPYGSEVYSDNGVQITLPSSYVKGDVDTDLPILMEGLQTMSEENADNIQALYEKNKEDILFWAYDSDSPSTHMTSVLVMKNEEFAGVPLALLSVSANVLLNGKVDSLSQSQLTLGDKNVLRFLTTSENAGVLTAQAIYFFNESGKLWIVGFFTSQEQYGNRLPTFDAAVESFIYSPED